ncbi:hypothetical protein N2152v2_008646 [Parachlorella kessleri]
METEAAHYEPLPSMPEEGAEPAAEHALLLHPPDLAASDEVYDWGAVPNLDTFFTRIYRYWEQKGFVVMVLSRVLNLAALGFTVAMSALLLLVVDWRALQAECLKRDTCDLMEVAFRRHPLEGGLTPGRLLACLYLGAFTAYWLVALGHLVAEVRGLAEVRHFCQHKLGLSERQLATCTWPEVAHRLVQVQSSTRLCIVRDLTEHDVVSRVMRKENFLIAMLNKGVLALNVPIPGLRHHFLLTKTVEWNLYWCLLDTLFDDHFRVRRAFLLDERALRRRFRVMAVLNLLASPFMLLFLLIYFFMKNAERFYHHPSTLGARRWSQLAKWRLREFNELPHFISHRLNASQEAAELYIQQFPNHALSHVARFVAFVSGSFAALLLALALIDERLLERDLLGRQIVWWVATVGMVLALSRAFIIESSTAFDPEVALMGVVAHTHYLPRHWRGRAHTREVQEQFEALFQYKALLFVEELASTLLTPFVLAFSLPKCAGAILRFVEQHTTHIEGVGDVCSLAAFDFARHGSAKYGAPGDAPKGARSRQGKMEKSFLSFAAAYPQWEPQGGAGRQFLGVVAAQALNPRGAALAASVLARAGFPIVQQEVPPLLASQLQDGAGPYPWHAQHAQHPLQQSIAPWLGRFYPPYHSKGASDIFASAELADATGGAPGVAGTAWGSPARGGPQSPRLGPPAARGLGSGASQLAQRQGALGGGSILGPLAGAAGVGDAAERVAVSQMLLQSIYEDGEEQQQQHPPQRPLGRNGFQQHQGSLSASIAGVSPARCTRQGSSATAAHFSPYRQHQAQQQGPSAAPQQQAQQQQRPLMSLAQAEPGPIQLPMEAPRQVWQRPSPPLGRTRQLSSELSVLSREPSAALGGSPLQRWPIAASPWPQQQQQQGGTSPSRGGSLLPTAPSSRQATQQGVEAAPDPSAQLRAAAAAGDASAVHALLRAGRADRNSKDPEGLTPLHLAASKGHLSTLVALLEAGAQPDLGDAQGRTALHWAAFEGRADCVRALLDAGSSAAAVDAHGSTPLHFAASSGQAAAVEALVAHARASTAATDSEGLTPLHRAMDMGHVLVARMLLEVGADVGTLDKFGRSPVDLAAARGHGLLVEALRPPEQSQSGTGSVGGGSDSGPRRTSANSGSSSSAGQRARRSWSAQQRGATPPGSTGSSGLAGSGSRLLPGGSAGASHQAWHNSSRSASGAGMADSGASGATLEGSEVFEMQDPLLHPSMVHSDGPGSSGYCSVLSQSRSRHLSWHPGSLSGSGGSGHVVNGREPNGSEGSPSDLPDFFL